MAADNQPDIRKRGGDTLFLLGGKVSRKDDEIGFSAHLRQDLFEGLDDIENGDPYEIPWMRRGHHFFGRNADNSKPDSFHVCDLVFLYLRDGRGQVGRQQRKSGFAQSGSQNGLAVVELVITDGAGRVSNPVHYLDRRLALEFVADESAGKNVACIKCEVRLHRTNERGDLGQATHTISWKELSVKVIRMRNDNVDRGLCRHNAGRQRERQDNAKNECPQPVHQQSIIILPCSSRY